MSQYKFYRFGPDTDGNATMKNELGGKGANLAEMASLGIPVPPGFTIPCAYSVDYQSGKMGSDLFFDELEKALWKLSKTCGGSLPLLSVRSGARVSMPGMMDTILNVGLCEDTLPAWRAKLGDRVALDSYRRLIQMYASVALEVPMEKFEHQLEQIKLGYHVTEDKDLPVIALETLVSDYLAIVEAVGKEFPKTVIDQIKGAVLSVFKSWMNPRAIEYRKINNIPSDWGTAVTIQSMVFGNMDDESATGVLFSRDPSTGAPKITGEFLINAQGEDVVAGTRTPLNLDEMAKWNDGLYHDLVQVVAKLEEHYKDMQDIEFTVQSGNLYLLQTRSGKRSAKAAFKIARDMLQDGTISVEQAKSRVNSEQLIALLQDTIDPEFKGAPHLTGIAAGGGLVTGKAMLSSDAAINCTEPCILVRKETDPDDIGGMHKSLGILTATGGLTSHAAVVARGMNKSCVVGCTDMSVSATGASVGDVYIKQGDKVTIDGATGRVWFKIDVPVVAGGVTTEVLEFLSKLHGSGKATRFSLYQGMVMSEVVAAITSSATDYVHFDTALIDVEEPQKLKMSFQKLRYIIEDFEEAKFVFDLSSPETLCPPPDLMSNFMFGVTPNPHLRQTNIITQMVDWPLELRARCTVTAKDLSPKLLSLLKSYEIGVVAVTKVKTFADLLDAPGSVEVDPDVLNNVFGGVLGWTTAKQAVTGLTGKEFKSADTPTPHYWYEMPVKEGA